MHPIEARIVLHTVLVVAALIALRLAAAAWTPLTFDEAYYWLWSKNLAGGYYDHPPMVALVIRAGTVIAGDTSFGVRLASVLLAIPMSWAVYHATAILFGGRRVAASATILLNVTLMAAVGTMIVTPDAPLLVSASLLLFALAKVLQTGQGAWWLAVGIAAGAALLSKYTALFFGPAILIWLIVVPKLRHWLLSPWLYLGGLVALAMFAPVILWNADHHWVSFIKQMGRARIEDFRPAFIAELVPTQVAFATPLVFILGAMGLHAFVTRPGAFAARVLIHVMFWTIVVYFVWHSLHARVEANWFAPVYPAFAVAAAVAAMIVRWEGRQQRLADFCRRWAAPSGVVMFTLLIVQANTGVLTGYRRDATVRSVGVGWPDTAAQIEAVRERVGATCVLAPDYGTTSWLAFYLPKGTCVAQQSQHIRWVNMPEPSAAQLAGKLLYVHEVGPQDPAFLEDAFARVEKVAAVARKRGPLVIETYALELLEGPKGDVFDRSPPPELQQEVPRSP
jgi:4-amino-4-deoxy-L-arabinose transferase-like glycosyltransferase